MDYYADHLWGPRLRGCYDVAPPRVRRYLAAELAHVLSRLDRGDTVLELGCGYGRFALPLAESVGYVVGVDTARGNLLEARACEVTRAGFLEMDVVALGFRAHSFDATLCIQNGVCAFRTDRGRLFAEAVRVTRPGGRILFSSYADSFWPERLRWFRLQAEHGLLGEIDEEATRDGVIVCRDGFRSETMGPGDFRGLCAELGLEASITVVDESSTFCEIVAP